MNNCAAKLLVLGALLSTASAGFYVEGEGGYGEIYNNPTVTGPDVQSGYQPFSSSRDTASPYYLGALVGYELNEYLSAEFGFYNYFESTQNNYEDVAIGGAQNMLYNNYSTTFTKNSLQAYLADVKLSYPIFSKVSVYGKIGGGYLDYRYTSTALFSNSYYGYQNQFYSASGSSITSALLIGAGANYNIASNIFLTLNWGYIATNSGTLNRSVAANYFTFKMPNINMVGVGVGYKF